jgi:hypothetical protein
VVGVLVDFDHIPRYVFGVTRLPLPLYVPHLGASRFLHPFAFMVGCGVLACAGGCLLFLVLRDIRESMKSGYPDEADIARDGDNRLKTE